MEPRPFAFHKMEALIKQMQDPETGVPVRSQKTFLTSIPSAFMGYDLIEWLMEHLNIEESGEAVHLANQLCQYGYLFPVADCKNLTVKDDNSLYRFQAAYYWPWHHRNPDNVEYAIYLVKRTLRNKQRHALEDYEVEALASLKKNLQNKWELITMQAEEQAEDGNIFLKQSGTCIKVGKERKKMEKLVADSQERAYWRVHRPPPGYQPPLEPAPISSLRRNTIPPQHNTQVEILRRQVARSRIKVSQAVESLVTYSNTYAEYDPLLTQPQPSNPWLSDDPSFWQFNLPIVEIPTEKRVKRWALSFEDLLADPSGVEEFTSYLRKEYSHENIRFWLAVKELRHCAQSQVATKVNNIYQEFLTKGAPCEINIDSKTLETTLTELKNPSRFTFDVAAHHVYAVLLKKDCYPRFIRSDHYKNLLANALHPPTKKRFFAFVSGGKKKSCAGPVATMAISKRRGSDRSLTGIVHEPPPFAPQPPVPLSSSQANLHDISLSRDGGISPERIYVPHSEPKHHLEAKLSSEDEMRVVYEGSSMLEAGPSKSGNNDELCGFVKSEGQAEINIEVSEEQKENEITVTAQLSNFRIANEPSSSKENPSLLQVTTDEDSSIQLEEDQNIERIISEFDNPEGSEKDIVIEEQEVVQSEEPEKKVEGQIDPQERVVEEVKRVKEVKKDRKEGRKIRLLSDETKRGSSGDCKFLDGRKQSLFSERHQHSVDEEGTSHQNLAKESASTEVTITGKVHRSGAQNPADICPWEDEESCKTEETFVKKYATLGYL